MSKYAKSETALSGDTQFDFRVANFRFDSDAYEWMVISGAKARYQIGAADGADPTTALGGGSIVIHKN